MKITSTILSIPPYLSTTWKNVSSLHVREEWGKFTLVVILQNRVQIEVPHLNKTTIDAIFEAHVQSAEEELTPKIEGPFSLSSSFKGPGGMLESLGTGMQHNPEQAEMPPIPIPILKKIAQVMQALGVDDPKALQLPESEPHCNCAYCQIARFLSNKEEGQIADEKVEDAELTFRDWEVKQSAEQLYVVTNPLDQNEQYNVFLGTPVGCTCGSKNCEHIRAVLKS